MATEKKNSNMLKEKRQKVRPNGYKEKRDFIRTDTLVPVFMSIDSPEFKKDLNVTTKNISATGLLIESREKLPTGIESKLELKPDGAKNPIHCTGKVVWSAAVSGANIYNCGVEFIKIEEDNKNTFLKFLCDAIYKTSETA